MMRRVIGALGVACLLAGVAAHAATPVKGTAVVEVIRIDGVVNAGMAHRVQRGVEDARRNGARAILVILQTNGGIVDDANDIRDALGSAGIPTIAFVEERAWSAGALIALACDKIVMAPGSSMGAALPVTLGSGKMTAADRKVIAALRSEFESLAEAHHRDPRIAAAMVDPDAIVPGLKGKGDILSLSPKAAKERHFIDAIATTQGDALAAAGYPDVSMRFVDPTWGERIAQFAADPVVSGLLLTIGFFALLIELQTLHLIAGVVAVMAFGLFFGAHIIAGTSNWVILLIFALGVAGLLFELHVLPGHGIAGVVGAMLVIVSLVMGFGGAITVGVEATGLALLASIALFFLALRLMGNPESAFMRRLVFAGYQSPAQGYVSARSFGALVGHSGVADSMLRPAGVAVIDGSRYQVQTNGEFLAPQTPVVVERVEGAKIIVRRVPHQ